MAEIAVTEGDPLGLLPGTAWLVGHADRCALFDNVPAYWKDACYAESI